MYPLNMQLAAPGVGFAVANHGDEHVTLTEQGYQPAFVPAPPPEKKGK